MYYKDGYYTDGADVDPKEDNYSEKDIKAPPEKFYDLVSPKDTLENGIHVIEYHEYKKLREALVELVNECDAYVDVETMKQWREVMNFNKIIDLTKTT